MYNTFPRGLPSFTSINEQLNTKCNDPRRIIMFSDKKVFMADTLDLALKQELLRIHEEDLLAFSISLSCKMVILL